MSKIIFGNKTLADVISQVKMRRFWSVMGPHSNMTGIFIKSGNLDQQTHRGSMPCEDCSYPLTRTYQKLRDLEHFFPWCLQRKCGPAETLILDFWPPEL